LSEVAESLMLQITNEF